jgi:hypothetical protein
VRLSRKVAVVVIAAVLVMVFFFAPIAFWLNERGGPALVVERVGPPVYRSLGCIVIGYGDLYAPGWFGFSFVCDIPVPIPR